MQSEFYDKKQLVRNNSTKCHKIHKSKMNEMPQNGWTNLITEVSKNI